MEISSVALWIIILDHQVLIRPDFHYDNIPKASHCQFVRRLVTAFLILKSCIGGSDEHTEIAPCKASVDG